MKDLHSLADECIKELDEMGIRCGTVRSLTVNTRAKGRYGQCRRVGDGVFDISIAESLLADEMADTPAKSTIIHELLHTVDGCSGHCGKWKALAEEVNKRHPQYNIKRTSSREEMGLPPRDSEGQRAYKYVLVCTGCGNRIYRKTASAPVRNPAKYRCARCGGKICAYEIKE